MKINRPLDYAQHIIQARMCIQNIERNMNQRQFDVAQFMARELKLLATAIEQSIQEQAKK